MILRVKLNCYPLCHHYLVVVGCMMRGAVTVNLESNPMVNNAGKVIMDLMFILFWNLHLMVTSKRITIVDTLDQSEVFGFSFFYS